MTREILYMLGVVATGFAVNYTLRALPFLLFAGRDRELPAWALRFGDFLSPVIIAGLIIYSYSGLGWRTAWPYLAGALTVALHLWKRNALASIVAGTLVYMLLLNCGCATKELAFDALDPAVEVTASGVTFADEPVRPEEIPGLLDDLEIPRDRVIHIRLAPDVRQEAAAFADAKRVMGELVKAGYKRPILVTERKATSVATGKRRSAVQGASTAKPKPKIRYKPTVE